MTTNMCVNHNYINSFFLCQNCFDNLSRSAHSLDKYKWSFLIMWLRKPCSVPPPCTHSSYTVPFIVNTDNSTVNIKLIIMLWLTLSSLSLLLSAISGIKGKIATYHVKFCLDFCRLQTIEGLPPWEYDISVASISWH